MYKVWYVVDGIEYSALTEGVSAADAIANFAGTMHCHYDIIRVYEKVNPGITVTDLTPLRILVESGSNSRLIDYDIESGCWVVWKSGGYHVAFDTKEDAFIYACMGVEALSDEWLTVLTRLSEEKEDEPNDNP